MKILIISNMYPSKQKPYSGIFVKNQYEYLKNELHENIEIYAMKRTYTNGIGSIVKYLRFYIDFVPYLFKKYNLLHVHFFGYHIYLGVIYKIFHPFTKLIVTVHGGDTKNIKNKFFKLALKNVDVFIAVGTEQSENIKENISSNKVKLLSAGIDENTFYYKKDIKKIYDFIFIGSFYDVKGIDIFIEAIKINNRKDTSYCFVGSGKYSNAIKEISKKYNITIKENKTQDEIRILLNQSKWLVLPSRGDSFGLVVSEAMFCGTPVIVSNIGGMKDQVVDGYNGYILGENTPENLASKILLLTTIKDKDYEKFQKACLNSNHQYSLHNVCAKLIKIYKEV